MMSRPIVRDLGTRPYLSCWRDMQSFTHTRQAESDDEIWLVEHSPVFTRGLSCRQEPHQNPKDIEVVDTDRGGQITYHGPGQLVAYLLFDLKRSRQGVRHFVSNIEQAIIDVLSECGIDGRRQPGAPGVYVNGRKIASLGIRVRRGASYHGLSLNVNMDTEPFRWIDPCGYRGLEVVNLSDLNPDIGMQEVKRSLSARLMTLLQ